GRQTHAPVGAGIQIGIETADIDEAPFARVGLERDPGDSLQCFGGVDVGQLDDLAQWLRVDNIRRLPLLLYGRRAIGGGACYRLRTRALTLRRSSTHPAD